MAMQFVCDWEECGVTSTDLIEDEWDIYYPRGESPPRTFCTSDHAASYILNSIARFVEP
jgi:hypothetical protein